jgi:CDP-diacylglycerol--glycerol-3-phosphate 3-phosphatidyltransferase
MPHLSRIIGNWDTNKAVNLPNLLSGFRLAAAPFLLFLGWQGYSRAYLVILILSFLTDALDGYLARKLKQETQLGVMLDTWGDVAIYIAAPLAAWWLWPEIVQAQTPFVVAIFLSFGIPALAGIIKFRDFTSYHTWAAKVAAASTGSTALLMLIGGPDWPFRVSVPLCVLAAIEQIAITLVLDELKSNVRSLWHVLRQKQQ